MFQVPSVDHLTKDHVILRMQVERLPAKFRSRHQFAFTANLQIRVPALSLTNDQIKINWPNSIYKSFDRPLDFTHPVLAKAVRNGKNDQDDGSLLFVELLVELLTTTPPLLAVSLCCPSLNEGDQAPLAVASSCSASISSPVTLPNR